MKNGLMILLLLLGQNQVLTAQTSIEKIIIGTVVCDANKLEGISVINCMNKMMAVTDKYGCFSILAKEGDILNLSGIDYKYLKKYVYKRDYISGMMEVDMVFNAVELDEVIINKHSGITAENLGIPSSQVKLTPAERRLYTASDFKPTDILNSGKVGLDPLLNAINGRTKMLKKELGVEKKEFLLAKMEVLVEDKYYIETLKIPKDYIRGFQHYCIEDSDFVRCLNEKNKTMSMFLIVGLASSFNKNRESDVESH
jgi:hypothetical protein